MKKLLLGLCTYLILTSTALAAVNLNTATKEELDGVNGIGPVKAQAILDHRKKNGSFKSVDDLQNVKGFGNKSVNKVRSQLTIGSSKSEAKADTKTAR
ncbi:MAG: helix-hairpin-helix domain-containing protein [Candidatus Nitrotoga sp.]